MAANDNKTGMDTIVKLAQQLVNIATVSRPIILRFYGNNVVIIALLDAIVALGSLIPPADEIVNTPNDENSPLYDNPELALGTNIDAPPVVPPFEEE